MDAARVQLDTLDLPAAVLTGPGGPLVAPDGSPVHHERDLLPRAPDGGPVQLPVTGWRAVTGPEGSGLPDETRHGVVRAAPVEAGALATTYGGAAGGGTVWLVALLRPARGRWRRGWRADVDGPHAVRPAQPQRRAGLRLEWVGAPLLVATPGQLARLEVRVWRPGSDRLDWDPEDSRHVVAWVLDAATGERLPYEPHQAFGGYGRDVPPDAPAAHLPVQWATHDLRHLPPGRYGVAATLVGLNLVAADARLELVPG